MGTVQLAVPEEIIKLLSRTQLGARPQSEQIRIALATHPFQQGGISIGRAAELSGMPRAEFELLLAQMGIPLIVYDMFEYGRELDGIAAYRRRKRAS